jgi:hypothetical protein
MCKKTSFWLALALASVAQTTSVAWSEPLPRLPLTCSDENSIGLDICNSPLTYEIPANDLIVATVTASQFSWVRASDLSGSDPVAICTLPVEPGEYSSCRGAAGESRSIIYVPKSAVFDVRGVTVSKSGGHYTDPVTAAENAFAGDTWCVAPQWPDDPCVMDIDLGIFILHKTLVIPGGLFVAGAGKGNTMLVADNGVEIAVSTFGNAKLGDLTIVNSQPGGAQTAGLAAGFRGPGLCCDTRENGLAVLRDVAINVGGAARNWAVVQNESLDIMNTEISAVGQDTAGVFQLYDYTPSDVKIEGSHISAAKAMRYESAGALGTTIRIVDSRLVGEVLFEPENSLLEVLETEIVGNVRPGNDQTDVVFKRSSIKGDLTIHPATNGVTIADTTLEGNLSGGGVFYTNVDEVTVHGATRLSATLLSIGRSFFVSTSTAPALELHGNALYGPPIILINQTFVQGMQAIAVTPNTPVGRFEISSSVLAGSVSPVAWLRCTDTHGADYELLSDSCQPQTP